VSQTDCRSLICPPSNKCGDCQTDAACGTATSGKVCDDVAKTCENGCRGSGGNGCVAGLVCTSTDATIGKCVQCLNDTTCGSATSGEVCNDLDTCQVGCRGAGGNGCPAGTTCSSVDGTIGTCGPVVGPDAGPDAGLDAGPDSGSDGGPDASTGPDASAGPDASTGCATDAACVNAAPDDGILEGGGFGCAVRPRSAGGGTGGLGLLLFGAVLLRRRARRAR
jgi:hypothetical protein